MKLPEYETYQEKKRHGDPSFPYITYLCSIPLDFPCVILHWHDELELIYIKKGRGIVRVDLESSPVSAGDIVLVLPGQLHSIYPADQSAMEYENILFHSSLLLSRHNDLCSREFLDPLFSGTLCVPAFLTRRLEVYPRLAACIDAADEICKSFPMAYPFAIKSQLFQFFYLLFSCCSQQGASRPRQDLRSLDKIKQILVYIEEHYQEPIRIEDAAGALHISPSHFMKYFKQAMGCSFISYLNEYRLSKASRLLLRSSAPILEIAQETGFDNLSYFNRIFKQKFGTTPSRYRSVQNRSSDRQDYEWFPLRPV